MTRLRGAGLLVLALAVLHAGALSGGVYFQNDVQLMWLAGSQAVAEAVLEGAWPFWSHRTAFGEPLLANANHQVLYPPAWPGLLLPPGRAYVLLVVAHHAWLVAGAVRLARETGQSARAAVLVGLLTAASGPIVSLATVWNQLCGFAWVPWVTLAMLRFERTGSGNAFALASLSLAATMLAGSPEAFLVAATVVVVIGSAALGRGAPGAASLGRAAAVVLVGAALSAPQWVTTQQAARTSARARLPPEARLESSVHPLALTNVAIPLDLARQPLTAARRLEVVGPRDPLIASPYVGTPVLLLAALALSRRRLVLVLGGGIVLALLVALGDHGPLAGLVHLPLLGMLRYPSKALILVGLAVPLLAGLGWDRIAALPRDTRARRVLLAAAGVVGALVLALSTLDAPGPLLRAAGPGLLSGAVVAVALVAGGTRASLLAACVAALDLLVVHHGRIAVAPADLYRVRPTLVDALLPHAAPRLYAWDYFVAGAAERHLGGSRPYELVRAPVGWHDHAAQALALRLALYPPTAAGWGIAGSFDTDVAGLGSREVDDLRHLLRFVEGRPEHTTLLRLAAVTHAAALHPPPGLPVVARDTGLFRQPVVLLQTPDPLPRARLVDGVEPSTGPAGLVAGDWDMSRAVRLEGPGRTPGDPAFTGRVAVTRRTADRIVVDTAAAGPAHLVLAEAWDQGWSARLDGVEVDVVKANHAFMAVRIPAGAHHVELRYLPPGLATGTVMAVAGIGALLVALRRRPGVSGGTTLPGGSDPSRPR